MKKQLLVPSAGAGALPDSTTVSQREQKKSQEDPAAYQLPEPETPGLLSLFSPPNPLPTPRRNNSLYSAVAPEGESLLGVTQRDAPRFPDTQLPRTSLHEQALATATGDSQLQA